ncbi:MAG: HEAT repeat domain-containing protein [Myxococcota bacterium]
MLAVGPVLAQDDAQDEVTPASGVVDQERAVEMLMERLATSESYKVRAQAAVLLGRMGGPQAVQPLIRAMEYDEHFVVRAAAAASLGALGDDRAIEPLFAALLESEPMVRDSAAKGVGRLDARRNFDTLVRYSREGSPDQRRVAVTRLGDLARTGDQAAIDVLVRALGDEANIRDASAQALADLPTDKAVPILIGALKHDDAGVRAEAARLLGPRQDVRAVEALASAYDRVGEQERVRVEIRRSLERLRPLINLTDLIQQARSAPDKQLRARAIRLLGVVGDPRAASAMEEFLADPDPYIQGTAALALADMGSVQSIPKLEETLPRVTDTRAQQPVEHAIKKLKRMRAQAQ